MSISSRGVKERRNWLIMLLYIRHEHEEALRLIEEVLRDASNRNDFASYVKGLIFRSTGKIHEALELFRWSQRLNPLSIDCLKQVGRSLYLLGKARPAIEIYEQALKLNPDDWEVWHSKGLCHVNRSEFEEAVDCFRGANLIQKHDATFVSLADVYVRQENLKAAIDVYLEALEFAPENPELLTTLGLLYLRLSENYKAFQYLGNSLTLDPKNSKALLATGSIIQDRSDHDASLLKYRIVAVQQPNSAHLWNNIAMCFFGKQKYVAAIACLKRALYLDPFEWIVAYNLGIVHLNTQQYCSAFIYFTTAINLNPYFAASYMYLGLTLSHLGDNENACAAYEKSMSLEEDYLMCLNYAVTLLNMNRNEEARTVYQKFSALFAKVDANSKDLDPEIQERAQQLARALGY